MKKNILLLIIFLLAGIFTTNAQKALDKKVDALLSQMTLDEKIGQMTQVDYDAIKKNVDDIVKYSIGSILCGGNSEPEDITAKGWADLYDKYQNIALKTRYNECVTNI